MSNKRKQSCDTAFNYTLILLIKFNVGKIDKKRSLMIHQYLAPTGGKTFSARNSIFRYKCESVDSSTSVKFDNHTSVESSFARVSNDIFLNGV